MKDEHSAVLSSSAPLCVFTYQHLHNKKQNKTEGNHYTGPRNGICVY